VAIVRIPCTGRKRDSSGVFRREPGEVMHYPDTVSMENRPVGRGMEHPLPCPDVSLKTFFHASSQATPTARPLPRPPPAPFRGGGQCVAIVRIQCTGRKRDFMELSVRPIRACLLQGTVSMGNRPLGVGLTGRGVEHPPPLSWRVTRERFSWSTPSPVSCVSG